jgi:putative ABC transport system ATP-binding protein
VAEPLVLLEHVWRRFGAGETEVVALRDASLEIPPGEFVVFLGPSGSGKTTLLNLIGGLDRPSSGRVLVAGRDLGGLDEAGLTAYRRDVVGFIFQFFNLVPTLTARENVELVAGLVPAPLDGRKVLSAVGLAGREEHFPAALSGGEQQRVAIARALVKNPALLLADEPTGSLDYETGLRVLEVLYEVPRSLGHGVLLVTHNQEIARIADRVVRLHSGAIAEVTVNPHPLPPREVRW